MSRLLFLFASIGVLLVLGCSHSRKAVRHYKKAVKHGYKCEDVSDTIKITSIDSIPFIVNDSIVWEKVTVRKDTVIIYKNNSFPVDRYITKYKYKERKQEIKAELKETKQEIKAKNPIQRITTWMLILIFMILFVLLAIIRQLKQ